MRYVLAACAIFLMSGEALAMGGLWCGSEGPAKIDIQSGLTRGMGSPLYQFKGSVVIDDKNVPEDLRRVEFGPEQVPQFWIDRTALNLLLYREREGDNPHGYVEVTIMTQSKGDDDEGTFDGTYEVQVWDTTGHGEPKDVKLSGTISCGVE